MSQQAEFAALIDQYSKGDGIHETALPRVAVIKATRPSAPIHGVHQPALCILAQGRKQVVLGDRVFFYDATQYLVAAVDVPVVGMVVCEATVVPTAAAPTRAGSRPCSWSRRPTSTSRCSSTTTADADDVGRLSPGWAGFPGRTR